MQDISITLIRYYVTLVETKQFMKAAKLCHISQPALSKSIQTLESMLGTSLLKRYHRGFELTDAGKYFYEYSSYFIKLYDDFVYDINERVCSPYSGTVRISASGAIIDRFIPEYVCALLKEYPNLRIYTREEDTELTVNSVVDGKVDFGLALLPIPVSLRGSLKVTPIVSSSYHLVFPEGHPLTEKETVSLFDIDKKNIMLPGEQSRIRTSFLKSCEDQDIHPNVVFSCSQIQTLFSLVRDNTGFAVLPGVMLDSPLAFGLEHRPFMPTISWDLAMISPSKGFFSLSAACASTFFKEHFVFDTKPENIGEQSLV